MTHQPSWDDWNRWCDARIAAALAEQERALLEVVGEEIGEQRVRTEEQIEAAISGLRAEIAAQREHAKGEIIDLPSPLRRRTSG